MAANKQLLILAGDGIGPEEMRQVERVADWVSRRRAVSFDLNHDPVGGCAYGRHGVLPSAVRWERGLLRPGKAMARAATLRPALVVEARAEASPLKPELVRGPDLLIGRELAGGVYFGQPRGIETLPDGSRRGINTQVY